MHDALISEHTLFIFSLYTTIFFYTGGPVSDKVKRNNLTNASQLDILRIKNRLALHYLKMNERLLYHPHRSASWTLWKKTMLLNKGEASKLVKTTFDIWKARFYHKKALLVPTLQKDWSKEGVSAIIADHGSFTAEPEIVTQMLLCDYAFKLWATLTLQCDNGTSLGRWPQLTLLVILISRTTFSALSNTSMSFTAVPVGEPLCCFKRKKEMNLIIGWRNDLCTIWAS